MILMNLEALALVAWLGSHGHQVEHRLDAAPPYVAVIESQPSGFITSGTNKKPCAWTGRHAARIASGADPPLSDVTGITPTEPPGTGPGMDGPLTNNKAGAIHGWRRPLPRKNAWT